MALKCIQIKILRIKKRENPNKQPRQMRSHVIMLYRTTVTISKEEGVNS
jgi:hypothetical protein